MPDETNNCSSCADNPAPHPMGEPLANNPNVLVSPYTPPTAAELELTRNYYAAMEARNGRADALAVQQQIVYPEPRLRVGDLDDGMKLSDASGLLIDPEGAAAISRRLASQAPPAESTLVSAAIHRATSGEDILLSSQLTAPWIETPGIVMPDAMSLAELGLPLVISPRIWFPFPLEWLIRLYKVMATDSTSDPQKLRRGTELPRPTDEGWGKVPERECDESKGTYHTRFSGIYYQLVCLTSKTFEEEPTAQERAQARTDAQEQCFGEDMDAWRAQFKKDFLHGKVTLSAETAYLANADACRNAEQICPDLCEPFCRITDWFAVLIDVPKSYEVPPELQKERFGAQLGEVHEFKITSSGGGVTYIYALGVFIDVSWQVVLEVGCEIA